MSGFSTPGLQLAVTPLTGNELIAADTQLPSGQFPESEAISVAQLGAYAAQLGAPVFGTADNGTTQTLTAAMIAVPNAKTVYHLSTSGATPSLTLPLATAVFTQEGATFATGSSYVLRVINNNSGTATIVTNTGWTLTGTLTLATGTWREFLITAASATTLTAVVTGTGTYS